MKRISTHIANTFAKIKQLGRLTPIAIISMVLPMAGSSLLVVFGYPIGNWMRQDQVTGSVAFLLGILIFCGFAIIPTNLIGVLGGWSFGFWLGFGLLAAGVVGAATIAFFINLKLAGERLTDLTAADRRADAIYQTLVNEGFWRTTMIITLIRISVVMPFAFTNFFLAAAKVPIGAYVIGTAVGMAPRVAATTFFGAGLSELVLEGVTDHKMLVVGVAATVVMLIVISIISKRALMRLTGEELSAS